MKALQLTQGLLLNDFEKSLLKVFNSKKTKSNLILQEKLNRLDVKKCSKKLLNRIEKIEKYVSKEYAIKYLLGYIEYTNNEF